MNNPGTTEHAANADSLLTSERVVHAGEFNCPACSAGDPERRRDGDRVRFKCLRCWHEWVRLYRHVAGIRGKCAVCGEPALKTPCADYEAEDGRTWHVPWFAGKVLCWRHGYQPSGGAIGGKRTAVE
jgi:hypothetical protein